jgi:hypothetical protein
LSRLSASAWRLNIVVAVGGDPARVELDDVRLSPGEQLIKHRQVTNDNGDETNAASRKRSITVTVIVSVKINDGIVLAADSAGTMDSGQIPSGVFPRTRFRCHPSRWTLRQQAGLRIGE